MGQRHALFFSLLGAFSLAACSAVSSNDPGSVTGAGGAAKPEAQAQGAGSNSVGTNVGAGAGAAALSETAEVKHQPLKNIEAQDIEAALELNYQEEQRLLSDYELILQVPDQISRSNIYDDTMQPRNKKEKCLIPFMVNDGSVSLYWDGRCRHGLATGLGRAVRVVDGQKLNELLLEINPEEKDTLYSYLRYNQEYADSEVGFSKIALVNNKITGFSATMGYNEDDWQHGSYDLTYRYEDTSKFVSYTKVMDLINGEYSSIIAYPNFSHDLLNVHDNVLSPFDKTYRLIEGRTMIGKAFIYLRDGRLLVRDSSTGTDSMARSSIARLDEQIKDIEQKVSSKVSVVDDNVDKGLVKVDQYVRSKCGHHVPLFKGDETNYICDYLKRVHASYAGLKQAKNERQSHLDSYRQNQESRIKQLEEHLKSLDNISAAIK